MVSRGVVIVVMAGGWGERVFILGAFFHALENVTLHCVGVGLMG